MHSVCSTPAQCLLLHALCTVCAQYSGDVVSHVHPLVGLLKVTGIVIVLNKNQPFIV